MCLCNARFSVALILYNMHLHLTQRGKKSSDIWEHCISVLKGQGGGFVQLKMLTLCLSGRRCQQGTWCEKIRDAENQTVTPNTCTSHTETGNLCYKHGNMANDLAEARPVPGPDPLIKDPLTFPLLLQHIHLSSLPHHTVVSGCKHVHFMSFTRV